MSEQDPKEGVQLNLPFEEAEMSRLREMLREPVSEEERGRIHSGMEIYLPPELDGLCDLPRILRERVNGVIKVTDAKPEENMVGIEISRREKPDISEDILREMLARPFNGGLVVDGKEIVFVRQMTATATRDVVALIAKVADVAKKIPQK